MATQIRYEKADVLVIGGGLAGAQAALAAREQGAEVIVLEQAHVTRSGNAGSGVDHTHGYIPTVHEPKGYRREDMEYDKANQAFFNLGFGRVEFTDLFLEHSYEVLTGLEKYGVKVRGFTDSPFPEQFRVVPQFHTIPTSLHIDGRDIKVALAGALEKAGVRVFNRVQAVELLKKGERVTGAIGYATREDALVVISAKATILATSGGFDRIAPPINPGAGKNDHPSATGYGAGAALALGAGAQLVNYEFALGGGHSAWQNHGFMAGAPGGTWYPAGRVVDDEGNVVVDRLTVVDYNDPDYWAKNAEQLKVFFQGRRIIEEYASQGRQLYLDLSAATDEELAYIKWALGNEGEMWLFRENLDAENIDLRKVQVPLAYRKQTSVRDKSVGLGLYGIFTDLSFQTNVKGLFAAGAELGAAGAIDASPSLTFGWLAGRAAAEKLNSAPDPGEPDRAQVDRVLGKVQQRYSELLGDSAKSVERQVQAIVGVLGAPPHSDRKAHTAVRLLEDLKRKTRLKAENGYEIGKTFEAEALIEIALAVFHAILERKEAVQPFYDRVNDKGQPVPEKAEKSEERKILAIRKENGGYAFSYHQGSIKARPEGYLLTESATG
ncbi:MAG: FAD-dependent oxidoreductase [Clostridiales Family XIII bacterium]|jgi:succinate dehydrogenase/fumarate reductase flavoprotein subunit|nr:FAD-dependent oxidoreductase [Clostridiales Family XIII bacterium]